MEFDLTGSVRTGADQIPCRYCKPLAISPAIFIFKFQVIFVSELCIKVNKSPKGQSSVTKQKGCNTMPIMLTMEGCCSCP